MDLAMLNTNAFCEAKKINYKKSQKGDIMIYNSIPKLGIRGKK
jgi:hypothetical protein